MKRTELESEEEVRRLCCPEEKANIVSQIFFCWIFSLVYKGWKKPLQDDDLWELRDFERGASTTKKLIEEWRNLGGGEISDGQLNRALFRSTHRAMIATGILKAFDVILSAVQPVLVNRLLVFLVADGAPIGEGIGWSFSLLLAPLLKTIIENHYYMRAMRGGMRVRSSMQGAIYDKSLRMSPSARASSSLGEIVNLMQLDTQRIGDFYQFFHILWASPVQIFVTVGLLWNYIGVSAVIGLIVTLVTLPIQGKLMVSQIKLRKASIGITDRRVKLMNEILQGIKGVKLYAWEKPFAEAVEKERTEEVKKIAGTIWIRSAFMAIMMAIPIVIGVITFAFFSGVFDEDLDPARIFTGIALLNQLRVPVMMLPMTANAFVDARIGLRRIERFLNLEDTDNYSRESRSGDKGHSLSGEDYDADKRSTSASSDSSNVSIVIENGEFEWSRIVSDEEPAKDSLLSKCLPKSKRASKKKEQSELPQEKEGEENALTKYVSMRGSVLRDINVSFKGGQLVAVVGRVGSGKSSLIHAVLGEMRKVQGDVSLSGSVAYVAQTAWIFNDTLRNNITFGKPFDETLYRKALSVSALRHDISVLPAGDQTAIGEKGINLSGGQKQRVSIARAVYADADVYLFDDPLSALDSHVSKEVFTKCISNRGVLRDKLRVLITNQVHILPDCDNIVFLELGAIKCQGVYTVLANSDTSFQQLINEKDSSKEEEAEDKTAEKDVNLSVDVHSRHASSIAPISVSAASAAGTGNGQKSLGADEADAGKNLMQTEERTTGNVVARAYYQYAIACGGIFVFSLLILFWCATVALSVIVQWWLAYWSEQTGLGDDRSLGFFLGIYFALAAGYAIMTMFRGVWFLSLALYASKRLHSRMLASVLRAPLSFFDTTPIGRIISRFSRDVSVLDELLPQFFQQMLTTVLNLIASYVFIGTILPLFFAVAVPVTIVYFLLQRFFNRTSLELKRLDSISKSPIYAHFSETLGGLSTLRAYGKQDQSRRENMDMIDVNQRAYFSWIAANRWFSLNLEMCGTLLIFSTALFGVIARNSTFSGSIGLSLTYALQVTGILGFTVRSITELEGQMNSMERANYYCNDLPQEAAAESTHDKRPPAGWPATGRVDIENVEMRYREGLELVLKGVSVSIAGGEKVGIVGRTGSGKSSLMIAILRMVELAGGRIVVDGVDLGSLGLDDVRKHITIIPQDPVLFSGTIRFNLDPFDEHTEAELWDALEKSHMKQFVSEFEGGLDAPVSEYGENMSAGQRQVICLTRALLRNSKVLILDEASSSLDMETDRLIQETIRTHLKDATILTIAHRLFTLADYDKIIVMEEGLVAECGRPHDLLQREGGKFSGLVDSLGSAGASQFRQIVARNSR